MRGRKSDYMAKCEAARAVIHGRIAHLNSRGEYPIGRIAIRNCKSRWGSCSKKGNLNFHYKVAFLPERVRDYVIVHELCHLKEFNHSQDFWSLVGEIMPDYRELRAQLRTLARV